MNVYACMYVCTYVCMYVCMYVCTYVCMYVCMYVHMYVCTYVCMYVCMYICTYVPNRYIHTTMTTTGVQEVGKISLHKIASTVPSVYTMPIPLWQGTTPFLWNETSVRNVTSS